MKTTLESRAELAVYNSTKTQSASSVHLRVTIAKLKAYESGDNLWVSFSGA